MHLPAPKIPIMAVCCVSCVIWNTRLLVIFPPQWTFKSWICHKQLGAVKWRQACRLPHVTITLTSAKIQLTDLAITPRYRRLHYQGACMNPAFFAFWQLYSEMGCSPGAIKPMNMHTNRWYTSPLYITDRNYIIYTLPSICYSENAWLKITFGLPWNRGTFETQVVLNAVKGL